MSTQSIIVDDVSLEELERNPYPHYARWRRESPIIYFAPYESWLLTRWDDCDLVGRSEDRTHSFNQGTEDFMGHGVISHLEGDPHTRLRASIDTSLSPRAVKGYIESIARPVAHEYVSRIRKDGQADATADLLELISVRVIGDVLGAKDVDDKTLQRWFQHLSLGSANVTGDPETARIANIAIRELDAYMVDRVGTLTAAPDGSTISSMIHAHTADGNPRDFAELFATIRLIILGGFQEPGHGAAASLYGLLTRPEQAKAVAEDPSLIPAAVHEGLRWIAPFGATERVVTVDFPVGDTTIPAGDGVLLMLASANRDESRYEDPERFDLFRPRLPVASFGYGMHFCAGHFLGRELEKVILEEVFEQLPNVRLDPDHGAVESGFTMRGVKKLPIVWGA